MYEKLKPYLMLMPTMIIIVGVFLSGICVLIAQSFGYFPEIGLTEPTTKYFKEVFSSPSFRCSLMLSLRISLISTLGSVIVGVFISYIIIKSNKLVNAKKLISRVPVLVPHIIAAIIAYNFLSATGILSRILYNLNIIDDFNKFPILIFDRFGVGTIFAYIWKGAPYVSMVTYAVLKKVDREYMDMTLNLGATTRQYFWHVLLPLIYPTILSSFIILFAFSFSAFEIPFLLGSTVPRALPVLAYHEYSAGDLLRRPYSMVINFIITFICIIMAFFYKKSIDLINKYNR
ncbi:putative spermidine/putrescine transport system permease protein [Acetoanaerobium pronyense]|uniref:Spermidine/putrescine transport system permease protein n=2 Tax=Acetoanaerobium pronyense TaxID=1482736 RepID=A0ABS4KKX6_9FIRM|nr:putative spermidine/putrescine transport system permease protein [Acetoanaerobium pronyense]